MFRIFFVLALVFLSQDILSQEKREIYVIVHGAWGGGWSFKKVEEILNENKSIVYRPTLTGQGERVHLFSKNIGLTFFKFFLKKKLNRSIGREKEK